MSSKIRLGVIGTGRIAQVGHLPAIHHLAEAELIAVCDRVKERVDKLAKEWEAKEVYYDYRDLVKSESVDAVVVSTPHAYHREHTIAAAREGKHVFCQKPLATNLKDAREMVRICKGNKVKLQVGFNHRFWNQTKIAKELVDLELIGKIKSFEATYREKWDLFGRYIDYQSTGGSLIDNAIHLIDTARLFLGEVKEVCAEIKHSVIPAKVDDNNWLLCNFMSGASGCISSDSFSEAVSHKVALYGTKGIIHFAMEMFSPFQSVPLAVYTERSAQEMPEVVLKYFYPTAAKEEPQRRWISVVPPIKDTHLIELKAFCKSIAEDTEPPVTGEDGVKALEIVLAAYKSARERKWVTLPIEEEAVDSPQFE